MEYREIIVLSDEDGTQLEFERLDLIPYENKQYAVLMALGKDGGDLVILQAEQTPVQGDLLYDDVEDEQVLLAVFNQFKERHKDEFDFSR